VTYGLLALLALTTLFPFFYMVSISFMGFFEPFQYPPRLLPEVFRLENYPNALSSMPFGRFFMNSAVQVIAVVTGRLLVCSMAGYAFARVPFVGRDKIFFIMIATMMIPHTVLLVPSFLMLNKLGWVDSYMALIVPLLHYPWGIFLVRQFLVSLPDSLEEAARIDGAGEWTIYSKIFLPLSKPVLIVVALLTFTSVWTSFQWELIVTRSLMMRTISVGIAMFTSEYGTNLPYQMAAATAAAAPALVLFFVGQRYFMEGISFSGTVK